MHLPNILNNLYVMKVEHFSSDDNGNGKTFLIKKEHGHMSKFRVFQRTTEIKRRLAAFLHFL